MKPLVMALLLSSVALGGLDAQTQQNEFNREAQYYENLAVKLYPDSAVAGSPLVNMMVKMDNVMKANDSKLYNLSSKPIILAVEAASILKIQPHWEAATEAHKTAVFEAMTSGLVSTSDLTPPRVAQEKPPAPQSSFNPGSMNDDATANAPAAAAPANPNLTPTRKGYLYFYNSLVNKSGGLKGQKDGPVVYRSGPLAGMTEGQGQEAAQRQWAELSHDQQVACEQNADTYGTGPDPDAPSAEHVYNFTPNGMGGGTITGH